MTTKQNRVAKGSATEKSVDSTATIDRHEADFPIVGMGASAGGLAAFEAFFSAMPTTHPMAFVLVQHLAPDHKSILTDLIQRYTTMKVLEVEDGMVVKANCAYIIPPNRDMALLDGALQLLEPNAPRGQRMPIDFFFRSLALALGEQAICIVLSGTGMDGTLGVHALKAAGGMVMAQTPTSTEFDGMPASAIATGLVDYILRPEEMPAQLVAFVSRAYGQRAPSSAISLPTSENALRKVFILLRNQTSHDFSQYKPNTIHRRIERRMAVHQLETLDEYAKFLQQTPPEIDALFRELLIGVTSFFRDPDAFKMLEEQLIPRLFANKSPNDTIRVWSLGCSTGEEAYSLAILLAEYQEAHKRNFKIQIFATDIDSKAIIAARVGRYPSTIAADVSAERLARFFTMDTDSSTYRVHKSIRDMLVFSEQDVIRDPPFSRLDLISCRNVLIYMTADLQKRVIPLFHYALNSGGALFLGNSETVGEFGDQFTVIDRKTKLYQRKNGVSNQRVALRRHPLALHAAGASPARPPEKRLVPEKPSLKEVTEQTLLHEFAPVAVLVNSRGDILFLHGRTGMYLELTSGEVGIQNVLKMAREGLRRELTTALYKAHTDKATVRSKGIRVKTNSHFTVVNLTVKPTSIGPASSADAALYLIAFEEAPPFAQSTEPNTSVASLENAVQINPTDTEAHIALLKQELRFKEEYLQNTNEELETSNEELKSSNEEMQSVNEELQSTNEELETSKEELQSLNEELATVNTELQTKVADLSRTNNDMNNLLAGTCIGTVFVDFQLRILRFTPAATHIINLISSDMGRPVGHIVSNLVDYNALVADTQQVLDTLIPKELEVRTVAGSWYTMRILPYRTLDNVIEGAVITFVDITDMKQAREAASESEQRFKTVIDAIPQVVFAVDASYRLVVSNQAFKRTVAFGSSSLTQGETVPPNECTPDATALWRSYYKRAFRGETFSIESTSPSTEGSRQFENVLTPVFTATGEVTTVVVISRAISSENLTTATQVPSEAQT